MGSPPTSKFPRILQKKHKKNQGLIAFRVPVDVIALGSDITIREPNRIENGTV